MKTYGVLGWPVHHSLSPTFQNAGLRAAGIDAVYTHFPSPPERLAEAIAGVRALGVAGVNLTLPHKIAVLPLLDEVTPLARALGAVNTIVRVDTISAAESEVESEAESTAESTAESAAESAPLGGARLVGHNTDAPGLVASLVEADVELRGARVVVVGAGGAARAAVGGIAQAGAAEISVLARRVAQARELVAALGPVAGETRLHAGALSAAPGGLSDRAFAGASLVVQATSATLHHEGGAALARALPFDLLAPRAAVVDIVYAPRETAVLTAAAAAGCRTVDGVGMLLHQGAIAFELWTGVPAPLDAMRAALEEALEARAR